MTKPDLPGADVPPDALAIYETAFDAALAKHGDEQKAHASAFSALKRKFIRMGDRWVSRDGEAVMRMLGDKEFSAEERKKLAKSGEAMPGGSFPIENKGDLKRAIQAFGRAKNKAAAKAWIKKRAKALGATEMLPEGWSDAVSGAALLKIIAESSSDAAAVAQEIADKWKATEEDPDDDEDDEKKDKKKAKDAKSVSVFHDGVALMDGPVRYTKDGYLVAPARIARTGIQLYSGAEMGIPEMPVVRVYRPEDEVFSDGAMKSMSNLPITIDHPDDMVDRNNWGEHGVGHIGEEVHRDGEFVRVPLILMDGAAIDAYEKGGFRELSVGYTADIAFEPGVTPDGDKYDAVQRTIRGNHLALVPSARGGSRLRLGDDHHQQGDTSMVKALIDGQSIAFADELTAKHVTDHISKLQQQLADAKKKADDDEAEKQQAEEKKTRAEADAASKSGEITALKAQLDAAQAKLSGKAFTDAVKGYAELLAKANAVLKGSINIDGKEPAEIKRLVVEAQLGDAAKGMSDEEISGAFKWATADLKVERPTDRLADDLAQLGRHGAIADSTDAKKLRDAARERMYTRLENAWKRPVASA